MKEISIFFGESLSKKLPRLIKSFVYANGELVLNVDQSCIDQVLFFLRNHSTTQYKLLMDVTVVDHLAKECWPSEVTANIFFGNLSEITGVSVDTIQGFCVATFGSSGLLRLFRR